MNDKMFDLYEQEDAIGATTGECLHSELHNANEILSDSYIELNRTKAQWKIITDFDLTVVYEKRSRDDFRSSYKKIYSLFDKGKIDKIIIGYCIRKKSGWYIRHAWGIRDGNLIDSTLGERSSEFKYMPLFEIDENNIFESLMETSEIDFLELDLKKELTFVYGLKSLQPSNFIAILNDQNAKIVEHYGMKFVMEVMLKRYPQVA